MNSIFETESLAFFDDLDVITSFFDENGGKLQVTDDFPINCLKSPENQNANSIQFDLNDIFDSTSESETSSPQAQSLVSNESLGKTLFSVNSDEMNFLNRIDSIDCNWNQTENFVSSRDTIINIELNNVAQLKSNQTLIDLDEVSRDSESSKNEDICLTEEEKEVYLKEGFKIPNRKPLTKSEEKILKLVRRKIRNKKSAHISRERKKNYIDGLEKRVDMCTKENEQLQTEVKSLKSRNFQLIKELQKLQSLVTSLYAKNKKSSTAVMLVSFLITFCIFPHMDIADEDSFGLVRSQETPKFIKNNPSPTNEQVILEDINQTDRNKYIWDIYKTRYDI